jgi:hypothetical protein
MPMIIVGGLVIDADISMFADIPTPSGSSETFVRHPALDASDDDPVLSQSDIVAFYGSCDEDLRGKD